jgi:hypothetical protein
MKNRCRFIALNTILVAFLVYCLATPLFSQELKPVRNEAFIPGERLTYECFYDSYITGKVRAGDVVTEVKFAKKEIDGRDVYHIIGEGRSRGAFSFFYKVKDRFESFVDTEFLVPWVFIRRTHEGDYIYNDDVRFFQFSGCYASTRMNKKMPVGTHDIVSAVYFARTFDLTEAKQGDVFPVTFLLDDSVYTSAILFESRELVETDLGMFRCIHVKPMVVTGNVFSQPYPMDIWVTDDKNHIPILVKSGVIIGSVKMMLIEYKGLANPLSARIKTNE